MNLFVFIYYMVEMILNQMSEKKRILSLNEELALMTCVFRLAVSCLCEKQSGMQNNLERFIVNVLQQWYSCCRTFLM